MTALMGPRARARAHTLLRSNIVRFFNFMNMINHRARAGLLCRMRTCARLVIFPSLAREIVKPQRTHASRITRAARETKSPKEAKL